MTRKNRRQALAWGLNAGMAGSFLAALPLGAAPRLPVSDNDVDWVENNGGDDPFRHAANLRTVRTPQLRALCKTEKGVARAFQWAQETGTPFSIRSGGHCFEGLSQNRALIIDLRRLNQTSLSPDGRIATVAPGALIGEVNALTQPVNRVLPAGFCQTVGLGGHVGGGGMGLISRAFGLACDHLETARILTADGQFKTASENENADLFWALRGGGSGSFGIVTSSTFRTRAVPRTTFVEFNWKLPVKSAASLVNDWQNWTLTLSNRIGCVIFCEGRQPGEIAIRGYLVSLEDQATTVKAARALASFAPMRADPNINIGSFQEVADMIWPRSAFPVSWFKIASDYLAKPVPAEVWVETLTKLQDGGSGRQYLTIDALGGAVADISPNETAYVHRQDGRFLVQYDLIYFKPTPGPDYAAPLRRMQNTLKDHVTGGAYVNYPDRDMPNWAEAYWGENLPRLREIKRRHDPENVFHHAQSVPL